VEKETHEITKALQAVSGGRRNAIEELLPLVYEEMKGLAHARLRKVGKNGTIQTTDLVHESWMRLINNGDPDFESRRHFYGAAARAMRNILVEQARRHASLKRDSARKRELATDVAEIVTDPPIEDVLSLNEVLERLEQEHERPAEVVSLRFFGGLAMPEVAEILGLSLATAERDWRFARAWLQHELEQSET
jgi:RNA polymerase sigma factor (TIGR02999 family)